MTWISQANLMVATVSGYTTCILKDSTYYSADNSIPHTEKPWYWKGSVLVSKHGYGNDECSRTDKKKILPHTDHMQTLQLIIISIIGSLHKTFLNTLLVR